MAASTISADFLEEVEPNAAERFLELLDVMKEKLLNEMEQHEEQPIYVPKGKLETVKLMQHTTEDAGRPFMCQRVCGDFTSGEQLNPLKMMSTIDHKEYRRYPPGNNPILAFPAAQFYSETKHCQEIVQSLKTIPKKATPPVLSADVTEEYQGSNQKNGQH